MEVLGIEEAVLRQRVLIALGGFFVLFFIISPLGGSVLHRVIRRYTPDQDRLALIATGLIVWLLSFALAVGFMLRFGPAAQIGLPGVLGISGVSAGLLTGSTLLFIKRTLDRGRARLDPDDQMFGVWGEDARQKRKNMRRR
jgi:hypothetical protein